MDQFSKARKTSKKTKKYKLTGSLAAFTALVVLIRFTGDQPTEIAWLGLRSAALFNLFGSVFDFQ